VQIREAVPGVLNRELKDSETLGSSKLSVESAGFSVLEIRADVRLKHCEIKLHIICLQGKPFTALFLIYLEEVLNFVLNEVVFGVDASLVDGAFLLVLDALNAENARLL
jgi:hypothetical protein